VDKTEGKRPLGRHSPRWGKIVKWISRRWEGIDWVYLVQNGDQWRKVEGHDNVVNIFD
jgi:hypothetical protein